MATTTPNYGWVVPTSTDLVKDGATAIETLGDSIDASFVGLKGGTTGQVLSKTSGTDLAFTWVAQDDSNAIQNAIVDAKGDLIAATAADTPARLAVGTNGQVLTADSTASTGIKWATPSVSAAPGMVYVGGSTFSSSSAVNLNNIFTSTYANYKIVFNCTGTSSGVMQIRFRVSGSDNSTTNYDWQRLAVYGGTSAPERQATQTYYLPCTINTAYAGAEVLVTNPQVAEKKLFLGHGIQEAGPDSTQIFLTSASFNATTQFDGMSLFPSAGTITGTIRVYGLANS
jgi:hypothetical protein